MDAIITNCRLANHPAAANLATTPLQHSHVMRGAAFTLSLGLALAWLTGCTESKTHRAWSSTDSLVRLIPFVLTSQGCPHSVAGGQSTDTIVNSSFPPGERNRTLSPAFRESSARANGESQLIDPCSGSASSTPTMR